MRLFTTWLLEQTELDDEVGDLARDYAASPVVMPSSKPGSFRKAHGIYPGTPAHEALEEAARRWWTDERRP